ncbi:TRICHOME BIREFRINGENCE-LIKE 27 [Artemisia annua]|uniref:TRICHOME BIREFRINGENCE-LIKE 27 n=1 Tax=Artemisia annua TaxID=35608 RepID=A0A2U1P3B7_ARTAN|nr:TRICHOME BIREFRINGENCE-LIKE 27 [Artemisia annua]
MGGIQSPFFKDHPHALKKKLFPYGLYILLFIAIFRLYFFPTPTAGGATTTATAAGEHLLKPTSPPPPSKVLVEEDSTSDNVCDYTNGKWVHDNKGPLYNSSACGTIKDGQNCVSHGRPDMGYLYWRWKPNKCHLPRFDPNTFLQLVKDRHLAFVGDSLARNQLESLLCLLATVSVPNLVYTSGEDNKFRKWHFASHNVNVSVYWSPFLVKGFEKSVEVPYNRLHLDSVNDVWAKDLDEIDMVVLSIGHWYLHPAVFYYGDTVLGCHSCNDKNYTQVGFYDVYGMAFNTTLKALVDKKIDVIVTTFSPAHFEGDWDSLDACSKTKPFEENERKLEGMDYEMRRKEMEQVVAAKENAKNSKDFRLEALDVTKIALMRPDGHPGSYMYPNPFANGKRDRVPNDCVHWCLPGPIDTWNEIMLDIMKRWSL